MNSFLLEGAFALAVLSAFAAWKLFALRRAAYLRYQWYNPKGDCLAPFSGAVIRNVLINQDATGFILPKLESDMASAFLEVNVRATKLGSLFDPCLEIRAGRFCDLQFIERGAEGIRFFNVTRLLASGIPAGDPVSLRGRHLTWIHDNIRLHLCRERVRPAERVLVIAPHPDDAEIAAYGLYADTDATIVTISSGDGSDRFSKEAGSLGLSRSLVARIRTFDSVAVPQLAGIAPERALNLCYPDAQLEAMRDQPARDFQSEGDGGLDFAGLREMNRSSLLRKAPDCSWESLVADLAHILRQTTPGIIVMPHPWLDPHSDHKAAALAVGEAMAAAGLTEGRFFFYTNHNRRSEFWPFGPPGSGVAMLPLFEGDIVDCEGFYSHTLSAEKQLEKYLALESMHDLREIPSMQPATIGAIIRRFLSEIRARLHGLGREPAGYFRRSVRPDELFFTTSYEKGGKLWRRLCSNEKNLEKA